MTSLPWKDWEQKTGLPHVPVPSRAPPPSALPSDALLDKDSVWGEFWK